MALKPTIYKVQLELADSDRGVYDTLQLTIARHPSETLERTTARVLVFALNSDPRLEFTRGLSSTDEPDLWQHSDSGDIEQWIEVGQPEPGRLRKASGRASRVQVYAFGKSAATWWAQNHSDIEALPHCRVIQLPWEQVCEAATLLQRNSRLGASIVGGVVYLNDEARSTSLEPVLLFDSSEA